MTRIATAVLVAAMALAALPAKAADAAALAGAKRVMSICIDTIGDARATRAAFKAEGLRLELTTAGLQFYAGKNYRFLALSPATLTQRKTPECGVLVQAMTFGEGEALAASLARERGGVKMKIANPSRDVLSIWGVPIGRKVFGIHVLRPADVYYAKGTVLMLQELTPRP